MQNNRSIMSLVGHHVLAIVKLYFVHWWLWQQFAELGQRFVMLRLQLGQLASAQLLTFPLASR